VAKKAGKTKLSVPHPNPDGTERYATIYYVERKHRMGSVLLANTPLGDWLRSRYPLVLDDVPVRIAQRARVLWWQRTEHIRTLIQPSLQHIERGHYYPRLLELAREIANAEDWSALAEALETMPERTVHTAEAEWSYAALSLWCRESWLFSVEMREFRNVIDGHALGSVDPRAIEPL